jgi:hypothetical protein
MLAGRRIVTGSFLENSQATFSAIALLSAIVLQIFGIDYYCKEERFR